MVTAILKLVFTLVGAMSHDGRELDAPRYAGLLIRGVALLLDGLLICMACFPITRLVKGVWLMQPSDHRWNQGYFIFDPLCLYFLLAIIAYFILLEGLMGATLGKWIAGIRVVSAEGKPIGMTKSIIRNALRVVDGLPVLNIVGIVLILTSPHKARFGDRVAGTRVVRVRG